MSKNPVVPSSNSLALGQAIRNARRQAKLTQQAVATQIGIARTTLVAIEKGERQIRPHELTHLATIVGVEPSLLLAESGLIVVKKQPVPLTEIQARVLRRLTSIDLDPILAKLVTNLYDTPPLQEAIASTLIHLLSQHEAEQTESQWLQENQEKGA